MKHFCHCLALVLIGHSSAWSTDTRRNAPVTLDGYHPFHPVAGLADWQERRAAIRLRTQVAAGLWPLPEKPPLNPTIHGTIDCGDYTVSKVFFESMPGHFVTGSLFQPAGPSLALGVVQGKRAGVLCPHGHWKNGRFYDAGEKAALAEIACGAERFLAAARNPLQARCVQLARMGCVAFLYDMLGYADSIQFPEHRNGPRSHLASLKLGEWGFVSPAADARLQTNFGLQTWNSIRSLDFVLGLPGIDPSRILVTGASGGGTQTMILAAIDDRVTAAFPCVMVSTAMQGGCTCENSHHLRIGQGNMDIAAAVAPKPLGLTAADDWTVELKTKGHPDLQGLYGMLGVPSHYEAHFNIHFKHNYNHVSRTQMYQFANRHLRLGLAGPVLERDFLRLEQPSLTVWDATHPAPAGEQTGEAHEKSVCRWWSEDAARQIDQNLRRNDRGAVEGALSIIRPALHVIAGRGFPSAKDLSCEMITETKDGSRSTLRGLIRSARHGEEVPVLVLRPEEPKASSVIWLTAPGTPPPLDDPVVRRLVAQGSSVLFPELFGPDLKSNLQPASPGESAKRENQWKQSSVYHYGYNHSLFARRVQDVLTCIAFLKAGSPWGASRVTLSGGRGTAHWAAAALALAGPAVDRAVLEADGFRFAQLNDSWHPDFLPGAVKYGDILGMLSAAAPGELWIAGQDAELKRELALVYRTLENPEHLHTAVLETERLLDYLNGKGFEPRG